MRWIILIVLLLALAQKTYATNIFKGGTGGGFRQTGYGEDPIVVPSEYRPTILKDAIIK